ncbi:MAG: hypothetical protein QN163_02585 [Armatimonadota bacterium]|nr:hypothetical protein [Armatimonadota bacterium]MDR5696920.1 hypothetical protein [Armatimonadota bacterium]
MRHFHRPDEIVIGYDEKTFPKEAVAAVRTAWQTVGRARTMPFLRADPRAPAGVLVTFGTFADEEAMSALLAAVAAEKWKAARCALVDLFRAAAQAPVEFQFRYDWDGLIVRGRFCPRSPADLDLALCELAPLAERIRADRRAGLLPAGAGLVTATFDGRWRPLEGHGYDARRGGPVRRVWRGTWGRADVPEP